MPYKEYPILRICKATGRETLLKSVRSIVEQLQVRKRTKLTLVTLQDDAVNSTIKMEFENKFNKFYLTMNLVEGIRWIMRHEILSDKELLHKISSDFKHGCFALISQYRLGHRV